MAEVGNSPHARAAMEAALALARAFGAHLEALTCLDERTLLNAEVRELAEEEALAQQAAFKERCGNEGVSCATEVNVGERRPYLLLHARRADLLVIGGTPNGRPDGSGFARGVASFAREAAGNVLFVHDRVPSFRNVVVGYAGRENSGHALRLSAQIVERAHGTLHIVTSDHDLLEAPALRQVALGYVETLEVSGTRRTEAVCHTSAVEPSSGLLDVAEEVGADLVAVGAYRYGKPYPLAFGRTAQRVLEWSPAAVLVCR